MTLLPCCRTTVSRRSSPPRLGACRPNKSTTSSFSPNVCMTNLTSHDLADYTSEDDEDLQAPRNMQCRRFIVEDSDDEDQINSTSSYEDEDLQPPPKMQRRRFIVEDSDDEDQMVSPSISDDLVKMQCVEDKSDDEDQVGFLRYSVYTHEGDLGDSDDSSPENDDELVGWIPYPYRVDKDFDELNDREVYSITVEDAAAFDETDRRRMLDDVECGDHFIGCSVQNPSAFYARLNKEEADKVKGVKGVFLVVRYDSIFRDD